MPKHASCSTTTYVTCFIIEFVEFPSEKHSPAGATRLRAYNLLKFVSIDATKRAAYWSNRAQRSRRSQAIACAPQHAPATERATWNHASRQTSNRAHTYGWQTYRIEIDRDVMVDERGRRRDACISTRQPRARQVRCRRLSITTNKRSAIVKTILRRKIQPLLPFAPTGDCLAAFRHIPESRLQKRQDLTRIITSFSGSFFFSLLSRNRIDCEPK